MGDHRVRLRQAGIRGIFSVLLLFLPYFFLWFGAGASQHSSVRWQCLHCPAAQSQLNSHSACFAQPLGPSPAAREGVCWNARTKAPLYLPACLQPGDHTGGTRGLSPLSFACTGLALCRHKELLLVTQLWHYPRVNSYATIFFSLFHFVAALCQKGEAFQNIFRDLI